MRGEGRTGLGGGQDRQGARVSEGKHKTVQAEGTWEEGEGAKKRELGLERGTDSPEGWRRRAPRGVGGAEQSARRQELGSLRADVQEGSAWHSSLGLGALDPRRPTWGGVVRGM